MSNYRRANTKGGTYFFTVVTYRRQGFLCGERVRSALREGINSARKAHPFNIVAWVLLPDHLHCIWTLPLDDADFGVRWAIIKRFVTKQCNPELKRDDWMKPSKLKRKESTLWQRRFWEHQIRDEKDFEKHVDYIHYNPVKHGLAKQVLDLPKGHKGPILRFIATSKWAFMELTEPEFPRKNKMSMQAAIS